MQGSGFPGHPVKVELDQARISRILQITGSELGWKSSFAISSLLIASILFSMSTISFVVKCDATLITNLDIVESPSTIKSLRSLATNSKGQLPCIRYIYIPYFNTPLFI